MRSTFTSVDNTASGTALTLPAGGHPDDQLILETKGATSGICIGPQGSTLVFTAEGSTPSAGNQGWFIPDGGTLEFTRYQAEQAGTLAAIATGAETAIVRILAKGPAAA